jgi:putative peptidoglycan lipid II flippase
MLLSPILFALSNTLGSMLVSLERFFGYGISPVLYNLGIIAGAFAVPAIGPIALVLGTLAGAALHLASRGIALWHSGYKIHGRVNLRNKNFRQVLRLMIPRMAGQPIEQLTFFLFTSLASSLAVGSIAILNFARNFHSVPVALFGISFSVAMFPILSKKAALGDRQGFIQGIRQAAIPLALVTAASALFFIVAGRPVIDILLGGGRFGPEQVTATASLLVFFALSIPAESFIHLLVRAFYALKDTWTPIFVTAPGLVLIYFISKLLLPGMGLAALPTTYAIVVTTEAGLLAILLRRKLHQLV